MSDGFDRMDDRDGNGGGNFAMGLLTGAVIGAGLGLLFAPKAGKELRRKLTKQAGELASQASDLASQASDGVRKATENAGEWVDRGREAYTRRRLPRRTVR